VKPEKLTLAAVVERSVEASAPRAQPREQTIEVHIPDEPVELQGDVVRLSQVLSNLINNASKFSGPGTTIRVNATFADREARISVKDEGAGIDPAFLPHIFDLFAQGDQSLDRAQGGLGIGLTLVKHLVELHGGRVSAFSEGRGKGTEVVIHLPARQIESAPAAPAPVESRVAAQRRDMPSRILVVDDLAASADTLMMLLQMEGFEVKTAHEGMTALKIAEDFHPDVVLLDIGLPGMNGFEVAHRLRSQPQSRDALLIALTGYGEAESRSRSAQAGFDHHMVKPADVNQLLALLAQPRNARQAAA
jgi:CheY-like chemotaxis protein